jgi:hypothetical protein
MTRCEDCAVQKLSPPDCYPDAMFTRMQMIYNAFAVYDNTLVRSPDHVSNVQSILLTTPLADHAQAFSVANEPNLVSIDGDTGETVAPCVKAMIRDARNYASSCSGYMREVPIGVDMADIPPREQWISFFDCALEDDEFTRTEWCDLEP